MATRSAHIDIELRITSDAPAVCALELGGSETVIDYSSLRPIDRHFETIRNALEAMRRGWGLRLSSGQVIR